MPVKVVKINSKQDNFTCYIGRDWAGLPQSPFHNPFPISKYGTREYSLLQFAVYWYAPEQAKLRAYALTRIGDHDILGCWCHPLHCHGDIIAGYLAWKHEELGWGLFGRGFDV
jgi:hypothetical protein